MRRETQHVLLLLLGGALIRIAADDTFLRYVRPGHRWLLIGAGAVMVALAAIGFVHDVRDARGSTAATHDHPGAERHAPWLLLVPVLVIALVAPPALGADAVTRAGPGNATVRDADVFPALPAGPAPELGLGEFVQRAVWDGTGSLTGREVALVGFVVHRGGAVELARLTIACCAADARPSRVRLTGPTAVDVPADTWLRVHGTVVPGSGSTRQQVPDLTVTGFEPIPAPADPYEY